MTEQKLVRNLSTVIPLSGLGFLSLERLDVPSFALCAGLMVKLRPNLLPYFAIVHALIDVSVLTVYLNL